ncbi:beta strand repeat-containing protein, partial [Nocardia vaccinii]|uniref:beta strand repeat-containing protein n=1 Tax=Nocardia vaccinii TaxID=1822 RepID=UPI001FDFB49C
MTGTGFTGATAVHFGVSLATSFTVVSDTQITAVAPARTGIAAVTVTAIGGTSNPVFYTYIPAPTLAAVTPDQGPETGGNTVTLTGGGFTGATVVQFGATPAVSFTVVSDTDITAVVPAGTGSVNTTVTTAGGTSNSVTYSYVPAPVVGTVSPNQGPETGGNTVTLTGTGFTGTTAVHFGPNAAVSFTVVSDTEIIAVAPAGTGAGDITVTTPGGSSVPVPYTYVPAPTLSSVVPGEGPETGGNTVTLTGTGFTGTTAVHFGVIPAPSFTVVSDTQITAVAPARTGTATVTVTATGGTSNPVFYTYVSAPMLAAVTPDQGPETGGNTVTLTGTGLTGTTAVHFGATPATSFTVVSDTDISAVAPAGTGTVNTTATTPGGTTNNILYTYVPAPTVGTVSPNQGPETGGNTVTVTGTGFTGTTAVHFGPNTATSFAVVSDTEIIAVVPAGTGSVNATVTTMGGTSNPVTYTYVLIPTLTSVAPNQGPETGGNTVILTGTNLLAVDTVLFGPTPAASFTVDSDTQITAVAPAGTGTVSVTVSSPTGASNGVLYTYGTAPALRALVPALGPEAGGNSVVLQGSNFTGALAVNFGATPATSFTVDSDTQITAVAPAGTGTVLVTVTTPVATSNTAPYTYLGTPVLSAVVPSEGPEIGGNTVTLTGTGFTGTTAVQFGPNTAVSFTVVSDTEITAVVPAGTGSVNTTVTTAGGTSNPVTYTYAPVPTVGTVSPNQGPETGGNTVTLTGTGFTGTTAVHFGPNTAVSFTVVSDTEITAVVPAGTGAVDITVTTPGGSSVPVPYTYVPAPTLSSIVPGEGPETGGNTVTVTGTGFTGTTAVHFGVTPATSFTVVSDTEITAIAPARTGTAAVTVSSVGGTSNPLFYTYIPAPTLAAVTPDQGPETGGNTVTLTGGGFTGATVVQFGATPATSFIVVSDTDITAVVPAGTGTVNTTVTTSGGTSNSRLYTYVPAPVVGTVSPNQGPETGGNTVTVTGTGFTGTT